ncbi:MAG: 50S ribosomal protein L17 [Deltaproteobacteria bacterium]|nr:50S ribosomal protein L17 [Deltaproteobacteria bacterium]
MRHRKKGFKLNRSSPHRKSLLRNLATSLILNGKITTTVSKAKALRCLVDRLFVKSLSGGLAARRYLLSYLYSKKAVNKVFFEWLKEPPTKRSGFCRIYKLGWRKGDGADLALVKLSIQSKSEQKLGESTDKSAQTTTAL